MTDVELLLATIEELRAGLPMCSGTVLGGDACKRVATFEHAFECQGPACDYHLSILPPGDGLIWETGWAKVARRLGW